MYIFQQLNIFLNMRYYFYFYINFIEKVKFIKYFKKNKLIKICLCVIGKQENLYVKEYVDHYKKLGYNHIFIYDNNEPRTEKFSDILKDEIKNGFITIINYIGYKSNNNSQQKAYYDCYKKNKNHYDWLSFFDFDEFLELKQNNITIQEFLGNNLYKNCQNIKINWLIYKSENESLYFENKPLQLRFGKPKLNDIANKHIKSTVRGHLKENYWSKWSTPHSSSNNFISCSSSGKKIDSITPFLDPPEYQYAKIKHYGQKSFEEYCKKLKRGWPDSTDSNFWINKLMKNNKNNTKKTNIIKKIFNNTK